MKVCNKCEVSKPLAEFYKDKSNKTDGHYSICKVCKHASTEAWRLANKEHVNARTRKYNKANYQKLRLQRYGLTQDVHAAMLKEQDGCCAICARPQKGKRPLVVDHCHMTDKVRALLCYGCNRALHVLETPGLLAKALSYLKRHKTS